MSTKTLLLLCLLSSLIISIIVSFLMTRSIYRIHHQTGGWVRTSMFAPRIYLQPKTRTIKVGESFEASIIITHHGDSEIESATVKWVSKDNKIATVNTEGVITALAVGSTAIKPIIEDYPYSNALTIGSTSTSPLIKDEQYSTFFNLGEVIVRVAE